MHSENRDISIRETAIFESHLDEEADDTEKQQEFNVAEQDKNFQQAALGHHSAQLKPPKFPTYELFYKCASVKLPTHPGLLMPVCAKVQTHKEKFEKHSDVVDKAFDQLQQQGPPENAWTAFAPDIEVDRLECIAEREDINPDDENVQDDVPEYQILEHGVVPQVEAPQFGFPKLPMSSTMIILRTQHPEEEDKAQNQPDRK
ncbi:hypothetical protein DPX16_0961 [Anabarilius grahami]|uniref:Uncharacterized protein n=1 Tax=Anabarilius grahami TaxID=495550 RepID=A0A3N0YGL8_ANAGA|nr:hypothetical protein DPX16_0961 [Anabarilius grahami]